MGGRLIDADKLKNHYAWWQGGTLEKTLDEMKRDFDTIVDLQPTVEAEPPTYEQIKDYSNKHDLVLVDKDLWNSMVLELQTREVVLCKDCKHHEDEEPGMVYCPNIAGGWVSNDFHCGDAERKDEVEE